MPMSDQTPKADKHPGADNVLRMPTQPTTVVVPYAALRFALGDLDEYAARMEACGARLRADNIRHSLDSLLDAMVEAEEDSR